MTTTAPASAAPPAEPTLLVSRVRASSELAKLRAEWEALDGGVVFRSWLWLECWWHHYRQPGCELYTAAVHDSAGELVGLAPWYLSQSSGGGRVVRFLGSGEVCSDYLTLLARPEWETQVAEALADWLAGEAAADWDLVDLAGMPKDSSVMNVFRDRLRQRGHIVHQQPELNSWRLSLPNDWEHYLAGLSPSRRQRTRMLWRRNFETGRTKLLRVETPEELERAFAILVDLHQKRRASLAQAGCFSSGRFTSFHREVAARLLASGQLRLLWLELEGRPIAVEYGFSGGDTIYYYQGGFDPEFAADRPGWLAFAGSLNSAIAEGYRTFDFLRGDESYKHSWGAEPVALERWRIVARRPSAHVRHAAWRTGETVKRWARKGWNLAGAWKSEALRAVANAGKSKWGNAEEHTA